jgi:hypothetical protein
VPPTGAGAQFPVPQPQTHPPFVGAQPPQLSSQGISLPLRSSSGQNGAATARVSKYRDLTVI